MSDGTEKTVQPGKGRAAWTGRMGFVLAAAASAVGLGNMWRFPYLAAKYGGGMFLVVNIIFVITFGFTLIVAEIGLGRHTKQSAIGAYSSFGKKFKFIGVLSSIVPFIITPYYCVIGGWVLKYMISYITESASTLGTDGYFSSYITSVGPETFIWFFVFAGASFLVVALGVKKGVEGISKILMPALVIMAIGLSIYSLTLPGAMDGLSYYLVPDPSKFSVEMVVAALGQSFFSLSLAMGIMITYGSYLPQGEDIEKSTWQIQVFDTGIAILAGLMIIPASVSVMGGIDVVAENAGPGLMFGVLPQVFEGLGGAGAVVGFVFFLLVLFAALTSAISLVEACVSIVADGFKCSRKKALIVTLVIIFALGIICDMGYNVLIGVDPMYSLFGIGEYQNSQILDFMDFLSNTILMPIVAFLTCIFIGWIIKPKTIIAEIQQSSKFRWRGLFTVMIKFVSPVLLVVVMVFYILNTVGVVAL